MNDARFSKSIQNQITINLYLMHSSPHFDFSDGILSEDGLVLTRKFIFFKPFTGERLSWADDKDLIEVLFWYVQEKQHIELSDGSIQSSTNPNLSVPIPTGEQVNAYTFLDQNELQIGKQIIDALFEEYNSLRTYYNEPEDSDFMPLLRSPMDLTKFIRLGSVHILPNSYDAMSFVGYYFSCKWDEEHGIGLLTHKDRVLQTGHFDQATDFDFQLP